MISIVQGTPIVVSCSLRCTFAPTARPRDGEIFTCNNGKKEIQCEAKTSCATIVVTGRDNDDGMISNEFARCKSGRLRQKEGRQRGKSKGVTTRCEDGSDSEGSSSQYL